MSSSSWSTQAWEFCHDLSGGKEVHSVRAIVDRPKDLLTAAKAAAEQAGTPLVTPKAIVPRVLPPHFVYIQDGYSHVTSAARSHLNELYVHEGPDGETQPADMWSGCRYTQVHYVPFDKSIRACSQQILPVE